MGRVLTIRGISYLVDGVPAEAARADLAVIHAELHCTAVMLIGADTVRMLGAAEDTLEIGLEVWIRPQVSDRPWREVCGRLGELATGAEELRGRYPGRVTLLVGSEFTHTVPGMVPGWWSYARLMLIVRAYGVFRRRATRRLDALLERAVRTARERFEGPVGYAAAGWEDLDWSRFDVVGVNLYRSGHDPDRYAQRVRELVADNEKPVVITEFGCGAFEGADRRGAGSFRIVRWFSDRPHIRGEHPRDERIQAGYLGDLIGLYETSGVHGCFVFTFAMPDFPHSTDPRFDLDRAGFGVVKFADGAVGGWTPKQAFHEVARRYRRE
ncbi:hypothetical protein IU481_12690 [Nocardia otitidiscaviarum]|nr:hypothetical protein [Nocardia otitidiscaviarum]